LTGAQVADYIAPDVLLDRIATAEILHGDKGYDTNAVRHKIESNGAAPNIPSKTNRVWKNCFSPYLYRNRNASACSDASKTLAGLQQDTTVSPKTSSLLSASPLPCAIGYESGTLGGVPIRCRARCLAGVTSPRPIHSSQSLKSCLASRSASDRPIALFFMGLLYERQRSIAPFRA
jgi:hypothetical protein